MNNIKRSNIFILFYILVFINLFSINDVSGTETYVISNGGRLVKLVFDKEILLESEDISYPDSLHYLVWPVYNKKADLVYFEARKNGSDGSIYSIALSNESGTINRLISGRYPALSPNAEKLLLYRHPNQLWLYDVSSGESALVINDVANIQPVVWISNHEILYLDTKHNLIIFDLLMHSGKLTGYSDIIPGSLSPDGQYVLCGSYEGDKVLLYDVQTNAIRKLISSRFLTMGTSFVWLKDGQSFLYTKQSWNNLIQLIESRDLLMFSIRKSENKKIFDRFGLFGSAYVAR